MITTEEQIDDLLNSDVDYFQARLKLIAIIDNERNDVVKKLTIPIVSGSTDIPKPYTWLKEGKFKIAEGATYHDPRATITQCAGWITEYVKKYYR